MDGRGRGSGKLWKGCGQLWKLEKLSCSCSKTTCVYPVLGCYEKNAEGEVGGDRWVGDDVWAEENKGGGGPHIDDDVSSSVCVRSEGG